MVTSPRRPPRPRGLFLGDYHIRDIWVSRIAQAIQAERIGGFDLMILTETNIINQNYSQNRMAYNVVLSKEIRTADDGAQGRVVMIFRDQHQGWSI